MARNRTSKRTKKDYSLRQAAPGCVWTARFRAGGRSVERSTGTSDEQLAELEAPRIVAAERARVGKPVRASSRRGGALHSLKELVIAWQFFIENTHATTTRKTWGDYARSHWLPFFQAPYNLTTEQCEAYMRKRIGLVVASTVRKELSALRSFLAFCVRDDVGAITELPIVPSVPKRLAGVPHPKRRRSAAPELSPTETWSLILRLPAWSESRKVPKFAIRFRFEVGYETGLRPSTLDRICVPEHYQRGHAVLRLTAAVDKGRWARDVPLGKAARKALDAVIKVLDARQKAIDGKPYSGPIFGWHNYREHLKAAAEAALPAERAAIFAGSHLRSAFTTHALEAGANMPGVQYRVGHKLISTTARYVKPSFRAAMETLELGIPKPKRAQKKTA